MFSACALLACAAQGDELDCGQEQTKCKESFIVDIYSDVLGLVVRTMMNGYCLHVTYYYRLPANSSNFCMIEQRPQICF